METLTIDGILELAFKGIIDTREQGPKRCVCPFTNEPSSCITSKLQDARFEATQAELLVGIMTVDFAQNIAVAIGIFHCVPICAMHFEDRFDDLQ